MIVNRNRRYLPKTVHDHGARYRVRAGIRSSLRVAGISAARRRADRYEQAAPANPLAARAAATTPNA
jgi:hypothetical protein